MPRHHRILVLSLSLVMLASVATGSASIAPQNAGPGLLPARGGEASTITPLEHLTDWTCIHGHEGAWNDATGNGYWGGLQMNVSFMLTYGRDMIRRYGGYANRWSPRDQIIVAERAYDAGRGFEPWPNTARMCGLLA